MQSDQIIEKIRNKLSESDPAKRTVMNIFQFHFTDSEGQLIKSVGRYRFARHDMLNTIRNDFLYCNITKNV